MDLKKKRKNKFISYKFGLIMFVFIISCEGNRKVNDKITNETIGEKDINYVDSLGFSLLKYAIIHNDLNTINKIVNDTSFYGFNHPLYQSIDKELFHKKTTSEDVIEFFVNEEVKFDDDLIYRCVIFSDTNKFKLLLKSGVSLKDNYFEEGDLVAIANKYGSYEMVPFLKRKLMDTSLTRLGHIPLLPQ